MVSFWPWASDDTSPASFEKALSALSAKISKNSNRLDGLRQRSRRLNVLWTLYAGFAYLLCTVILVLVVGWRNWGLLEYAGIVLGPATIYLVRLGLTSYYDYRTSNVQAQLDNLEKQRNQTIEKLKAATKYNSTQDLLKKYGGSPTPKEKPTRKEDAGKPQQTKPKSPEVRTNFVPPPTANIPDRVHPQSPQTSPQQPLQQRPSSPQSVSPQDQRRHSIPQSPGADFAPNAFTSPPQYAQANEGSKWYDRFMDVLLGEDESLPSKRIALICSKCRLVNGQAPPGISRLEDIGKWRCASCGTMNGEENEIKNIVRSIRSEAEPKAVKEKAHRRKSTPSTEDQSESDVTKYSTEQEKVEKPPATEETPRRRSTRPKKGTKSFAE